MALHKDIPGGEMKTRATLTVELNVECPNDECEHNFNIIDEPEMEDRNILGELTDGVWSESCDKFECFIKCPECWMNFEVNGADW